MNDTTKSEDNPADDGDWLGYGVYADTLWARIETAIKKDDVGDDPLVIGLFGEWGAGKSHLLKLIQNRAEASLTVDQERRKELDAGFSLTIPVFFQPWKYEHEEFLHVPMLMHILDAYVKAWEKAQTGSESKITELKKWAEKAKPLLGWGWRRVLRPAAESFAGQFSLKLKLAPEIEELAKDLSNFVQILQDEKDREAVPLKATRDGHYYYRWHETMRQLTRPALYPELLKDEKGKQLDVSSNPKINFVVFIDDLDRCLPEKAVQTLELIKTMFNVESFAFVLALDDEVIERGIAHRYKDYGLLDKKQQMPITGFEYLEKIIHLPFRLPSLTVSQAERFVRNYEQQIETDSTLRWFDWMPPKASAKDQTEEQKNVSASDIRQETKRTDLLALALSGFDAYVPRKLIRMVELIHQIAKVARERKSPIRLEVNESIDARVVLVIALIQLFQPELYRIIRRRTEGFPFLLAAFSQRPNKFQQELLPAIFADAKVADVDLWRWVVDHKINTPTSESPWNPGTQDNIANFLVQAIANKDSFNFQDRSDAQQVRLPLVAQIVEHRAAQRHVFDVLKLIKALAQSMEDTNSKPYQLTFAPTYTTLLTESINQFHIHFRMPLFEMRYSLGEPQAVFAISNPISLAVDLLSSDLAVQANLVGRHNLRELEKIEDSSIALLERELLKTLSSDSSKDVIFQKKLNLLNGLQHIAPFVTKTQGAQFWSMVLDIVDVDKSPIDPKLRAQYHDVCVALGQDTRFDGKYALPKRMKSDATEAPAGFVKISMNHDFIKAYENGKSDNPIKYPNSDYYISRFPVTVAQFAVFRESAEFKEWSTYRAEDIRAEIPGWSEQLANCNRPIVNVNWYEATVYAKWLQKCMEIGDLGENKVPKNYAFRLPSDEEWEFAARGGLVGKAYPWGDEKTDISQRANVGQHLGHETTVGCYPANRFGLFDMAGNVWEWMANNHPHSKVDKSLRGGSWSTHPDNASCTYRSSRHPHSAEENIGFRLVLSLANL